MGKKNLLYESPPYAVEHAILSLANNLKTARLRRNLTMKEMAEKLGTVVKVIRAAENGIMTTSIVFYFSLIMGV